MPLFILLILRYVLGHEAMQKMSVSDVLIVGLGGLGVEIGNPLYSLSNASKEHCTSRCKVSHLVRCD